ncbi:MAG: hypothetical protein NWF01_12035 [Candidatus Bathyarchaeota archaeon]|nr:hypothetical protein [Candidatus Bathyarchaeota archaeon]
MSSTPRYTPLLPQEEVIRKSKGLGATAILWFDKNGKLFTKKPFTGDAYLTNQRLIFEGHESTNTWENTKAAMSFWPSSVFLNVGPLIFSLFLVKIREVEQSSQIRTNPVKLAHQQADLPSPLYFSFNDNDQWLIEIQKLKQESANIFLPILPPPPPDFKVPVCSICGNPLSFDEKTQKWFCQTDERHG